MTSKDSPLAGYRPGGRHTRAFSSYYTKGPGVPYGLYPFELWHWCSAFISWLACRWYDSRAALPSLSPGPDAGDPALVPLVLIGLAKGVFDLSDPLTLTFFLEYLHERPTRLRLWRKFEREHGPQGALYYRNAIGLAWEAAHAATQAEVQA
jgi:hypothetical protein